MPFFVVRKAFGQRYSGNNVFLPGPSLTLSMTTFLRVFRPYNYSRVFHKSLNVAVTGPAIREKTPPLHRRARACPSPCNDRGGQAPALREKTPPLHVGRGPSQSSTRASKRVSLAMQRSRGPVPRATGKNDPLHRRARACPSPCCDRGGQAPVLR